MKLVERIKKLGSMIFSGSAFESANNSTRRAHVPGSAPQDYKHEYQGWTRLETVKKSRYLMKNWGPHREQRDLNVMYAVGADGLMPSPLVESADWTRDAMEYFRQWSLRADVTERYSFADIQRLCSRAIDTDGEIFVIKVRNRLTGACRLQLLETHRVGNFLLPRDSERWMDGIRVDSVGRPTHIRVLQDDNNAKNIRFRHVLHLFDPESPSAYRHAPTGTHGLLHGLDEIELLALEKHAVKDNAGIVRTLKTDTGRLSSSSDFDPSGGVDDDGQSNPDNITQIAGGKTVAIHPHEELKEYESKRPSPTFTGFLEHLRRDSSLGQAPYEFAISPADITGPAIRLVTAKAQRRFRSRTALLAERLVQPVWFYVIGDAIDRGDLPAIKNWSKIKITPPRDVTVDAGRESEANRRDVAAGLKLPTTAFEEQGDDFLDSMRKKAEIVKAVEEIATETGVPIEQLFDFTVGSGASNGSAGTPPSGGNPG